MEPISIEKGNLSGKLFHPQNRNRKGSILVLHGSEGGGKEFSEYQAKELAQAGFSAFAMDYFGTKKTSKHLNKIDLEMFFEGISFLRNLEPHEESRVGVFGSSRGAEAACLVASLSSKKSKEHVPDAIAVHATTDKIVSAFPWYSWLFLGRNAWLWSTSKENLAPGKRIEIENYGKPILLSHGVNDQLWEVARSRKIEQELKSKDLPVEAHFYESERHQMSIEGWNDMFKKVIAFFERSLA